MQQTYAVFGRLPHCGSELTSLDKIVISAGQDGFITGAWCIVVSLWQPNNI